MWMPQLLKEQVGKKLNKAAQELYGIEDFTSMIADESSTEDPEKLVQLLVEAGHPVLSLPALL